jgi:hypothetical protein
VPPAPARTSTFGRAHDGPRGHDLEILGATDAYRSAATPAVTVATAMLGRGDETCATLASIADSIGVAVEAVVVDDGSNGASTATVAKWMERQPNVPALLVRTPREVGLAAARNIALDFARGAALLLLDADKRLAPFGLRQLLAALDDDLAAAFSYGMVACGDEFDTPRLCNTTPWDARDLPDAGLVDVALIRTITLRAGGGFPHENLWRAFAEQGQRGRLVPSIVGWATGGPRQLANVR